MTSTPDTRKNSEAGFTLVETIVAMLFAAGALLGFAYAFTASYANVVQEGESTMAVAAARQLLEDVKTLDLADIDTLNGFDTGNFETLPQDAGPRNVARRLHYSVAGGSNWSFTAEEKARWSRTESDKSSPSGQARIQVTSPSATLRMVTVTVTMPGAASPVQLTTRMTAL